MINDITPQPQWIDFSTLEDFNAAVEIIELWDKSRDKEVKKIGDAPDPDLTKPYTIYDVDNLRIWADNNVMNILT
jgi:hypothetical protein